MVILLQLSKGGVQKALSFACLNCCVVAGFPFDFVFNSLESPSPLKCCLNAIPKQLS